MLVAFGLGNPGKQYQGSRHNLGKEAVIELAERLNLHFAPGQGDYYVCEKPDLGLWLAVSTTYMNLSGRSALQVVERLGISPGELLVVCDDFNLPLGLIRLRRGGGDGGHKGLGSVIYELGTTEFPRLRLGIGPLPEGVDAQDFVLSCFDGEQVEVAAEVRRVAGEAILKVATDGMEKAMNKFNRRIDT